MPDWLAPIAYIPAYWGMLLLVGGAAALVFYVVWRSLNGDTRTWAVLPHFPLQVSHHNTWPFMLAMIGIGLVTLLPTVFFEAWAMEGAQQAVWNVFLVPAALVALSFFWWPLAWTPTWFKNWALRSKIDPETNPWTDADIDRVKSAPDSKRRRRALKDIARLVGEAEVEGLRERTLLERESERIEDYNERLGITDDMDSIERALLIKADRKRRKEQQKADGQAARGRQD